MGTFRLLPQIVVRTGTWEFTGGAVSDINVLSGISIGAIRSLVEGQAQCDASGPPVPFYFESGSIGTHELDCSLNTIELDGVPGKHPSDLPVGFTITSLALSANFGVQSGIIDGHNCISELKFLYDESIIYDNINSLGGVSFSQNISTLGITVLTLFGAHWRFRITFVANNLTGLTVCGILPFSSGFNTFAKLILTGTYTIVKTSFTLQNPATPVYAGDPVTITSPIGDLDKVTQIELDSIDPITGVIKKVIIKPSQFLLWTPFLILFYLPFFDFETFSGPVQVELIFPGTLFSGSVVLGFLEILYEDASGIYTLVEGQTDDVLYFRDGFTTDSSQIMLSDIREEENTFSDNDFFSLLGYPQAILSQNYLEDDYEQDDFTRIATLRTPTTPFSVEIPSPFIKTAFLP